MFWWTDPTLTEHLEIFGVGLWFTMPSSLTATSAKLDAQGPPLGHFVRVSKRGKWPNGGQRTFLAKIIRRVCRSTTGVYNPQRCHDL